VYQHIQGTQRFVSNEYVCPIARGSRMSKLEFPDWSEGLPKGFDSPADLCTHATDCRGHPQPDVELPTHAGQTFGS